jgi:hypothetical protein
MRPGPPRVCGAANCGTILATYLRANLLELADALQLLQRAAEIVGAEAKSVASLEFLWNRHCE